MGSASPTSHQLVLRTLADVPAAQEAMLGQVAQRGFPREAVFAIRLALDEALTNAIRHGNCCDASKRVRVDYRVSDDRFEATVCDEGCGFQPGDVPDPTRPENIERPHGRGVMLMRAYMTEVSFNDAGNCVTLVKHRDCRRPHAD
jgi:serine/threonine-protein kinase RsbW